MSERIEARQRDLDAMLALAPVVAVVVIERADDAVPLARALVAGGIHAIEVTLRTPAAPAAIRAIADAVDGACVGAGTVLRPADFDVAVRAGARFTVSPGSTDALLAAAVDIDVPWLPGAATASEALALFERGYRLQKFFPAAAVGGVEHLRSLAGPLPGIRFCPTGGIDAAGAPHYLKLANVACVGGSWLTPRDLVAARDWPAIESLARAAAQLRA